MSVNPQRPPTLDSEKEILSLLASLSSKVDLLVDGAQQPAKRYLTVANAATYADLSPESIRRLIALRRLTAHRPVRGRVLVDRRELDALILSSNTNQQGGRGRAKR